MCVCVLVTESCPILCDSMDCSPPGSSVHGILQPRIREWVAISFSRGSFQLRVWTWVSCIAGRFFIVWATREAHRLYNLKVKVNQSCPTLCDPTDCTVHGILQARVLEWVAFPFSRGSSQPRDWTQVCHIAGGFFTSWATREALILWILRETSERFWTEEWYDLYSFSRYMSILKNIQCYFGFLTVHKWHCAVYLILLFYFST